jgi:hypothetical protein
MKKALNVILVLAIAALITACKLAIIVVEGGEVQSTGSGTCIASAICVVDVTDPNFSETFTAIPHDGWNFIKWNSGRRFFCRDSTDPECTLSFEGYEETEAVQEMVDSAEMFYLMPIFKMPKPLTETITANGKVWAQVNLFTGVEWTAIFNVCQNENDTCSGVLNGYDMAGWKWASGEDVKALFNHYIGSQEFEADGTDAPWATAFFEDGWLSTSSSDFAEDEVRFVDGYVSNYFSFDATVHAARLVDAIVEGEEFTHDSATTREIPVSQEDAFNGHPTRGAWFYRTP